jgi:hypothetical protein
MAAGLWGRARSVLRGLRADRPAVVAVAAFLFGLGARWALRGGRLPLVWNDTADYLTAARLGWFDPQRWVGIRPVGTPLVLTVVGRGFRAFVAVQSCVAAAAWALLAAAVAGCLPGGWRRWAGAAVVLALSVTWPVTMWDEEVLSESLALSSLVLLLAAGLAAHRSPRPARLALLVAAGAWFALVRDSHAAVVALVGAAVVVAVLVERPPGWRRGATAGLALVAAGLVVALTAQVGHRADQPLEHVYAVRVLPYPERVAWFADHGMPDAEALDLIPEATAPGKAPFTPVPPDPLWARWRAWLGDHGRTALLRYAATHPGYLASEPRKEPERVFNNGEGIESYRALGYRPAPGVSEAFGLPVPVLMVLAFGALCLATWRRLPFGPLVMVGVLALLSAGPHALLVWHSDGMEAARHLLVPTVQLRAGVAMVLVAAVLGRRPDDGRSKDRPDEADDAPDDEDWAASDEAPAPA